MNIRTIDWKNSGIRIIDQTKLPGKLKYLDLKDIRSLWKAIKLLKVRGAPALGGAAGLGVYLGVKGSRAKDPAKFIKELDKVSAYLASSRPTARNLFWGLERARLAVHLNKDKPVNELKRIVFAEALEIIREDIRSCRKIGHYGAKLIKDGDTILTICNAGALATIDYGTALGVIYRAQEEGKTVKVYSLETRPLLQGARLTAWELSKKGIDVTVVADNTAALLMKQGKIDKVIAGADRIAANGDAANKIGTFTLAVLAKYHKIHFYIAAPKSTFDLKVKSGKDIPIEQRDPREVSKILLKKKVAPEGVRVFNPAFDVTPHEFISAIITDAGVIRKPFASHIKLIHRQDPVLKAGSWDGER